jgi:Spy/CpxP family protein refolding chaperone
MKISVILFVISLFTISASAQIERKPIVKSDSSQTTGSDTKVDKQSRRERFKELDLTREQKGKMKEIMQSGKAAKEAIENDIKLPDEDKKKQKHALQKEQMLKIQAILTPEQLEKFKAPRQDNP